MTENLTRNISTATVLVKKFLRRFDGIFFTPTLPKIGNSLPKQEKTSETWGHTALDLNSSISLQFQQRTAVVNISTETPRFPISFPKEAKKAKEESRCNLKDKKTAQPERDWSPQWIGKLKDSRFPPPLIKVIIVSVEAIY